MHNTLLIRLNSTSRIPFGTPAQSLHLSQINNIKSPYSGFAVKQTESMKMHNKTCINTSILSLYLFPLLFNLRSLYIHIIKHFNSSIIWWLLSYQIKIFKLLIIILIVNITLPNHNGSILFLTSIISTVQSKVG